MTYTPKRWIRHGLGAALLGSTALVACGGSGGAPVKADPPAADAPASMEGEGGASPGHASMEVLPIDKRVAFMSGHVAAGLALYRAGAPEQAARHLLHPVSETHAAERAGIDALGFDAAIFENVSAALDAGKSAEEIAPQLDAAEANINLLQENADADPFGQIDFLMDTCLEEYMIGVVNGVVENAGEYQDAYGFSVVARDIAKRLGTAQSEPLVMELELLVRMWPSQGPLGDSIPAPVSEIAAQVSRVKLELSGLR